MHAMDVMTTNVITVDPDISVQALATLLSERGISGVYLDHRQELDQVFAEQMREFERQRAESQAANPEFYVDLQQRIEALRASGWLRQEEDAASANNEISKGN